MRGFLHIKLTFFHPSTFNLPLARPLSYPTTSTLYPTATLLSTLSGFLCLTDRRAFSLNPAKEHLELSFKAKWALFNWLDFLWWNLPTRVKVPEPILSVVGDIPIDSDAPIVTSSISRYVRYVNSVFRMCSYRYGVYVCIHRGECTRAVSVCVCIVFLTKLKLSFSFISINISETMELNVMASRQMDMLGKGYTY